MNYSKGFGVKTRGGWIILEFRYPVKEGNKYTS